MSRPQVGCWFCTPNWEHELLWQPRQSNTPTISWEHQSLDVTKSPQEGCSWPTGNEKGAPVGQERSDQSAGPALAANSTPAVAARPLIEVQ